jgi:hypothetical protein
VKGRRLQSRIRKGRSIAQIKEIGRGSEEELF